MKLGIVHGVLYNRPRSRAGDFFISGIKTFHELKFSPPLQLFYYISLCKYKSNCAIIGGIIAQIRFKKKVKNRQIASHLLFLLPRDARYVQELPPWRIW